MILLPLLLPLLIASSQAHAQLAPSPTYSPPPAASGTAASTGSPNTQWAAVLGNSSWFYDAQRSGRLDQGTYGNRVEWRNDSGLNDGSDWNLDLTGGWYDAGDYIKATYPSGFTMFASSWGALTHGKGYDLAQQTAYLDGTLRWGYDWSIKAHPSDDVLFIQVGDTDVDNSYWGGDQNIPTPRPAYPINASHPGTDAWSSTAAAFAMGSLSYSTNGGYNATNTAGPPSSPSLANATYASTLLNHAETLYRVANQTTPYTTFSDSIPAVAGAYGSSGWGHTMASAALTLALATNQSSYYADAYRYYQTYKLTGTHGPWNWDSRTPASYVLFVEAASARPGLAFGAGLDANVTGWRNETEAYFDKSINPNSNDYWLTKGGSLYWDGDSNEASLNPAIAAAMLMFKYAPMASTSAKGDAYRAFAQSQVDYMSGKNPMNAVYLVGSHPNSPQNPHSAAASGGSDIKNIRTDPTTNSRVLYGAMVGGPSANDRYWDWRDDWVQNEVASDYNAMIPTSAAMQLMNDSAVDPYYVGVQAGTYSIPSGQPCDAASPCKTGSSGGAIAGIVIGTIVGLILIFGFIWYCYRKDKACFRRK